MGSGGPAAPLQAGAVHPAQQVVDTSKGIADVPEWFRGSRLNFAENLLRHRENDKVALYVASESRGARCGDSQVSAGLCFPCGGQDRPCGLCRRKGDASH